MTIKTIDTDVVTEEMLLKAVSWLGLLRHPLVPKKSDKELCREIAAVVLDTAPSVSAEPLAWARNTVTTENAGRTFEYRELYSQPVN